MLTPYTIRKLRDFKARCKCFVSVRTFLVQLPCNRHVACRYFWGMVGTGPFFVRRRTVDSEGGGGGQFLKKYFWAAKHLKIDILAWVPTKINK